MGPARPKKPSVQLVPLSQVSPGALALGALLHGIGKFSIPAETLRKPGRLTVEEWRRVREHALVGFDLLRRYHEVAPAVVDALLRMVAPFPVGTTVRRNPGEVGVAVRVPPEHPHRPTVRLLQDARGRLVDGGDYRELHRHLGLSIVAVASEGRGGGRQP